MKDLSAFIKQQQELKIKTIQNTNSILRMQIGIQILLGLILVAWILTTWLLFDMLVSIKGRVSANYFANVNNNGNANYNNADNDNDVLPDSLSQ